MNNKSIRLLLIGIGIGLILSSSLNLIFQSNHQKKLTPEDIRSEARRLGMIDPKEYFDKSLPEQNKTVNQPELKKDDKQPELREEEIIITIKKGSTSEDVARLLKEHNLIASENTFLSRIYARNASYKLQAGTYSFYKTMTIDEMIDAMLVANKATKN
ncbi:YceG-like family protein [Geosporobacter subterraneus DSM 17957]|uniref:YceG-like family protein n=1 Tax=Geosporobacter subterraneus DSM 17957 TaxID=1121919 RepID=A0A1M6E1S0_9FIRM|nr:endolytic transglycosylase MltG [Geosporobacter subterraneus]SHI79437.1 YceG-like family protein [Geosporobacter subterraneus DSM 17957]